MTIRIAFRSVFLAASAGALALAAAQPAMAAPGDWQQRGGGNGERGENRWGNGNGGAGGGFRQQAPAPAAPPARAMPQQAMPQQAPAQPRGGQSSWQSGGATPSGWRNEGSREQGEVVREAIRTRPYGAVPGPAAQPSWQNQADRGERERGGNDRGPGGWNGGDRAGPQAGQPGERPSGQPANSGWQREQTNRGGTWSRNGDAASWHREDGRNGAGASPRYETGNRNGRDGNDWNRRGRNSPEWSTNRQSWGRDGDFRRWNNGWRRDDRYDWASWRNQHRSTFHPGYYYAPFRGYRYSALNIGIFLGAPFYAEQYWITDPWAYRLPAAYGPYRWVRYYDDVILVDIYSGEVVDVIHDFFW